MLPDPRNLADRLTGHALRNARLRERSLERAAKAPPLSRLVVRLRAEVLGLTRLECARLAGISRGALRDLELGVHTPTRQTLQQFLALCEQRGIPREHTEELRRLYAGAGETLEEFLGRLELRAGSSRELARRVGISPTTLWEYRRGNFPLPFSLLRELCKAVGEDVRQAEDLWHEAARRRFRQRGLPEAWAELCVLCTRAGHAESHLLGLGVSTGALRRLRYLELPPWEEVAEAARALCQGDQEYRQLEALWQRDEAHQERLNGSGFGGQLKRLRERQGIERRELADLFRVGGKKPARIIKHIEEDGLYSAQAYPAGLAALLAAQPKDQARLLRLWRQRRSLFHRRRRPETRTELRLAREMYGFEPRDMEEILGYTSLEYQKIERGVTALPESALQRILDAVHRAGQRRVEGLLRQREELAVQSQAWQAPASLRDLFARLAVREGGVLPLARLLRRAGVRGLWAGRLRAIIEGEDVPAWPVVVQVGRACKVVDLTAVHDDWRERYREQLQRMYRSPLGVELRLLIGEVAVTLRELSPRLGFNYSVLIREFQRLDRDEPLRWFHVERLLHVLGLPREGERWREIRALWSTAESRRKGQRPDRRNGSPPSSSL
jgi:transcriptional regulator with XRE-family HTH domain